MSNNEEMNMQTDGRLEESLIQLNKLSYQMAPQLGICSARTHTVGFPQQSTYANGETMTWDSQTGAFYVDPVGSYLKFTVSHVVTGGTEGKTAKCFGSGSACNLFSRIVVRTRSGKELTRVENLNLLAKFQQVYSQPFDWISTIGRAQGFSNPATVSAAYADAVPVLGKTFIIPLCAIVPFFNTVGNGVMLPPMVMEGLRIEITLADPNVAFCNVDQTQDEKTGGSVSSYAILRPEIHWDCYTLADQFARRIGEIAATKGLNLLHKEYFHTSVGFEGSQLNTDVKKACSKALSAHVICRVAANITTGVKDSFNSAPYDWTSIQSQIGSLYNPNQPITTGDISVNGNMESYYFSLYGADVYKYNKNSVITPENFTGEVQTAGNKTQYNNCMINFNLNKSNTSDIVGTVVNNSRALLINMQKAVPVPGSRVDAYLCHVRAVKVFTSNAVILD
jgi:hypothetical protein